MFYQNLNEIIKRNVNFFFVLDYLIYRPANRPAIRPYLCRRSIVIGHVNDSQHRTNTKLLQRCHHHRPTVHFDRAILAADARSQCTQHQHTLNWFSRREEEEEDEAQRKKKIKIKFRFGIFLNENEESTMRLKIVLSHRKHAIKPIVVRLKWTT